MSVRTAVWIYGGGAGVAAVIAAFLFATGSSLAAIKLLLFAGLAPGISLFGLWIWWLVRRPHWYRTPQRVVAVMFLGGCVMVLVPLMLYMPWAPARFSMDDMPFGLPLIAGAGVPLAIAGALGDVLLRMARAWRAHDTGRVLAGFALLGMIGFFIARVIAARYGTP